MQQIQNLRIKFSREKGNTRHISAWTVHAWHQARLDRIAASRKNDGDCRGRRLGGERRWITAKGSNHSDLRLHKLGSERGEPLIMTISPAECGLDILALNKPSLVQACLECFDQMIR